MDMIFEGTLRTHGAPMKGTGTQPSTGPNQIQHKFSKEQEPLAKEKFKELKKTSNDKWYWVEDDKHIFLKNWTKCDRFRSEWSCFKSKNYVQEYGYIKSSNSRLCSSEKEARQMCEEGDWEGYTITIDKFKKGDVKTVYSVRKGKVVNPHTYIPNN